MQPLIDTNYKNTAVSIERINDELCHNLPLRPANRYITLLPADIV